MSLCDCITGPQSVCSHDDMIIFCHTTFVVSMAAALKSNTPDELEQLTGKQLIRAC